MHKTFALHFMMVVGLMGCAGSSGNQAPTSGGNPEDAGTTSATVVAAGELLLVDVLVLQPGKSLADAAAYFEKIEPVVNSHGLKRLSAYEVTQKMAGTLEPQIVNLWSLSDPAAFKAIMGDPQYQANIPTRNATFQMEKVAVMTARALSPVNPHGAGAFFVDLLSLQEGVDKQRSDEYFSRIGDIVNGHGLTRVGELKIEKVMAGALDAQYVNLWRVANPQTFQNIMKDPRYQANVDFRNGTFKMQEATMLMMKSM